MRYFFPGLIDKAAIPHFSSYSFKYTVNSGENAVRLLLKSYNLSPNTLVALPYYVCDSLKKSVLSENLKPLYLDIKDNTFWPNYDLELISRQNAKVIILVHFYGFIHPDTKLVTEYCKQNKILLIHDMAQSFGVDESNLTYGDVIYSFGAGKSTTAAGGGAIKSINDDFYKAHIHTPSLGANEKALLFMKSRIYGYSFSLYEKLSGKLLNRLPKPDSICKMSSIQQDAAEYVLKFVKEKKDDRNIRYKLLADSLKNHPTLSIVYDDMNGLHFKCIMYMYGNSDILKQYLKQHNIPYFCLFDSITVGKANAGNLPNFKKNALCFIELSTEASIPLEEIKRVSEALAAFK